LGAAGVVVIVAVIAARIGVVIAPVVPAVCVVIPAVIVIAVGMGVAPTVVLAVCASFFLMPVIAITLPRAPLF
jgi:hypothetical protein